MDIVREKAAWLLVLAAAYVYFLVLGPGLIDFAHKSVDRSMLVGLVVEGRLALPSPDRILYVDSLVMIGLNLLILAPLVTGLQRRQKQGALFALSLAGALVFLASGLVRIPLYAVYEDLAKNGSALVFPLNFLVNKNNPLLPFLGFGFLGIALGTALRDPGTLKQRLVGVFGTVLLAGGVTAYILLPDTMLKRSIDETWFCIMLIQAGFLTLVVLIAGRLGLKAWRKQGIGNGNGEAGQALAGGAAQAGKVRVAGYAKTGAGSQPVAAGQATSGVAGFVRETGRVSLTVFLAEPVLTGIFGGFFTLVLPGWNQGIHSTLAGGLVYLLIWLGILLLWRRASWRFGLEWLFARLLGSGRTSSGRWPIHKA